MSEAWNLLRLQEIDLELTRIRNTAEALPQRAKVSAAQSAKKQVQSKLNKIVGERKDLETDLNDLEVHKKFLEAKVTEVQGLENTDFRSTKDIEYSLSSLAKKLEKNKFESDGVAERLETVEKAETNARGLLERLNTEEQEQLSSFKQALAELKARIEALGTERKQVVSELSSDTLSSYEAASKRFKGLAVEKLEGNCPSVCRVKLQTSSYTDIRNSKSDICTCPYCKRLLVVAPDTSEE